MTLTIKDAISRVPHWVGHTGLEITPLIGGITNENFRIGVNGEVYVLRIPGADTELLGIDRSTECVVSREAGELGIGPEVFYVIEPEGYLVTSFIEGVQPSLETLGLAENIRKLAYTFNRIHNMGPIAETFSPFQVIKSSAEIARRFKVEFPKNFDWLLEKMNNAETALLKTPYTPRLCHNDLLNANFLDDGEIRILDWEYAGMGDPVFDLANFSAHHEFTNEQDLWLLKDYFGEISELYVARLKILKIISDFREAMWAMVQCGISKLDFDFLAYANKYFSRTEDGMKDENWSNWLKQASNNFSS